MFLFSYIYKYHNTMVRHISYEKCHSGVLKTAQKRMDYQINYGAFFSV
jgi:hypothetical protein